MPTPNSSRITHGGPWRPSTGSARRTSAAARSTAGRRKARRSRPTSESCAAVLDEVGLFDETIRRGEDWELNLRIRAAGYRVWFDPSLSVTYWPRESWTRLARQFRATGAWRGELVRRFGRRNGIRYFAPPALVLVVALAI